MATELVIKQDAQLNHLVLNLSPITRQQRREWFKLGLICTPIVWWGFSLVLLSLWMKNEVITGAQVFVCLVIMPLLAGVALAVMFELLERHNRSASRTLKVSTGHWRVEAGQLRIQWKNIEGWHLAPMQDGSSHQKLTLLYHRNSHRSDPQLRLLKPWSLIITQPSQVQALTQLLQQADLAGKPGARLLSVLPPVPATANLSLLGLSFFVIGTTVAIPALLGLLSGCWMLFQRNIMFRSITPESDAGNFERAVISFLNHFNGTGEIAWFLIFVGGCVLLIGGLMFRFGDRAIARAPAPPA